MNYNYNVRTCVLVYIGLTEMNTIFWSRVAKSAVATCAQAIIRSPRVAIQLSLAACL